MNRIAYLKITETQLKKSIIDCTAPVRAMLKEEQFHNYEEQDQGLKTRKNLVYLDQPDNKNFETVSMYRPNTKKGDPRIWFTNLKQVVSQGDELGIFVLPNEPNVLFAFNRNDYAGFQDEILTELAVERLANINNVIYKATTTNCDCDDDNSKDHDICSECSVLLCVWADQEEFDPVNVGSNEEYYCDDCYLHSSFGCSECKDIPKQECRFGNEELRARISDINIFKENSIA